MYVKIVLGQRDDLADRAVSACASDHGAPADRVAAVGQRLDAVGIAIPPDPWDQLLAAVHAVIASWNSERAITYRRIERIDDSLCTAVIVQTMVFGNLGSDSGTGVAFTRDPSTGIRGLVGDYLPGAQGEDVVAGTHAVEPLSALATKAPSTYGELEEIAVRLERHYRDMCDIEFTVERGVLWLLQVRVGKRSPRAALRIAIDMAQDPAFALDRRDAVGRVLDILAEPPFASPPLDAFVPAARLVRGVGASPGVASGRAYFDPAAVVDAVTRGDRAVLVRTETSPADVHGMADAVAIVTATGGLMSHAAVVARAWGKPAVVGVERLKVFGDHAVLDGRRIEPTDWLTVDGSIGAVAVGRIEVPSEPIPEVDTLVAWAGELDIQIEGTSSNTTEPVPAPAEAASWERRDDDTLMGHVLVIVAIKRWATPASLAQALAISDDRLAALLERLRVEGSLGEPTPRGVRLSEQGVERAARVFAETAQLFDSAAAQLLEGFDKPNRGLKEIVTAWQIRDVDGEQVPNRHDDAAYDATVVARLRDVHVEIDPWLAHLAETAPMIDLFRQRLGRALDRMCAGDHRWLVSPLLDSYHTVWFELHECLLRLARRSRSDEAKAGRAS